MARLPTGDEDAISRAREAVRNAKTIDQLRQAQAVLLPFDAGLSMDGCAQVLGISASWVSKLRLRFIKGFVVRTPDVPRPGGRNRQNLSIEEERAFLAPFIKQAASGGILVVGTIKAALDAHLGRITSLAATYNMLHRHDWRKLAPDKHHPKSDPEAQLAWKKNSLKRSAISMKTGQTDKN